MPDRLQELLQQRALIKEHLAWLEAEITAASGKPLPDSPPATAAATEARRIVTAPPIPRPVTSTISPTSEATRRQDLQADVLLEKLVSEGKADTIPDKSGCWLIFLIVLLACAAGAWLFIRYFYH